jgi:signal transduction histidine kinase
VTLRVIASRRVGTGLGLSLTIVKTLAELHDGSVEAISAGEGRGTEIVLHLPVMPAPESKTCVQRAIHRDHHRHPG